MLRRRNDAATDPDDRGSESQFRIAKQYLLGEEGGYAGRYLFAICGFSAAGKRRGEIFNPKRLVDGKNSARYAAVVETACHGHRLDVVRTLARELYPLEFLGGRISR